MNQIFYSKFILFIFIVTGISSCSTISNAILGDGISKKEKTIPPDFGDSSDEVLVVGSMADESYDEKIKKMVAEYYHGQSVFVTYTDLESDEYRDLEKYRYRFFVIKKFEYAPGDGRKYNRIRYTFNPEIRDMKTDVVYKYSLLNYNLKNIVKAYMKELEKERLAGNRGI